MRPGLCQESSMLLVWAGSHLRKQLRLHLHEAEVGCSTCSAGVPVVLLISKFCLHNTTQFILPECMISSLCSFHDLVSCIDIMMPNVFHAPFSSAERGHVASCATTLVKYATAILSEHHARCLCLSELEVCTSHQRL